MRSRQYTEPSTSGDIEEYIQALLQSPRMQHQVVYHRELPAQEAQYVSGSTAFSKNIRDILSSLGITSLYAHQASAIGKIRKGSHVVVSTPTASGKTLIYNLPVMERIIVSQHARAIYLFPLKALAQDQLRTFETMAAAVSADPPRAAVYDGDTTAWHRKKIRENLPNVILTNPEMLHLAFLPYHSKWADFFSNIEVVVVDEVHTYRGVMGSHMAQVFRRFRRVCERYGSRPTFVFSSATIANPAELCESLTGLPVETESENSAPRGKRHVVFLDPDASPSNSAIMLLKAALYRGLRTIVYTQSRKMAELISVWAGSRSGQFAGKISAYRAGFLPGQRREIERKLVSGELLAVISTSALELGIDIGDLDLCLLVGYPGTLMSTWQRGGRVGRMGTDSAIVLIGGEDALDQYVMRHPVHFFEKGPESAVINPNHPEILKKHLICAAAEMPLDDAEDWLCGQTVAQAVAALTTRGHLLQSEDGASYFSAARSPHRHVDLRGAGDRFAIISANTGDHLGEIDGFRAFRETHPGAIYLHMGETFRVEKLDLATQSAIVSPAHPAYYTRVRADKQTEILEVYSEKEVYGSRIFYGRLKVTDQVTGYERWHLYSKKRINIVSLDLPSQEFETEGIWFIIPRAVQETLEAEQMHFMGGIHAVEHAAIGICPLLVLTDRNDLGGISIPFHPQVGCAAVFLYDGIPGGIGLTRQAFVRAEEMFDHTFEAISGCDCETGCPACVHSPKCGSGNRPIDKLAALAVLERLINPQAGKVARTAPVRPVRPRAEENCDTAPVNARETNCYGVLDLETQRSADEVGGWHRARRMKVSCAVLYDSKSEDYHCYYESDMERLIAHLNRLDRIIGFNIKRFDYQVLSGYPDFTPQAIKDLSGKTLDMLETVHQRLGYRLSLNHLARVCLGLEKSADGLQALEWWKEGRIDDIVSYCRVDVDITHRIYLYGRKMGYLLFQNKSGHAVRLPVEW